jgi:hypothetical protein
MIASPFGTIHAPTFSFPHLIRSAMAEPVDVEQVNFDPRALDVKVWLGNESPTTRAAVQIEYPRVNRRLKGDRLAAPEHAPEKSETVQPSALQPVSTPAAPAAQPEFAPVGAPRPKNADRLDMDKTEAAADAAGAPPADKARSGETTNTNTITPSAAPANRDNAEAEEDAADADRPPEIPKPGESESADATPSQFATLSFLDEDAAERNAQVYFGGGSIGAGSGLEHWEPGAEPVLVPPAVDPDIKLSALENPSDAGPGGETVAGKDNVSRLVSPAERLGLDGKDRAKSEKCLADAVYFEARGEPLRGQMAVAQVVMNRVFSGFYPNNVCGVVYQNANRHLRCQFTFACEGKDLSRIQEVDMWEQAKRIAHDMLDGKIWLTEVGHATHYHAYWVHPSWVHEMKKMYSLGVHTFYRPRAWGDGSDQPTWGAAPEAPKPAEGSGQNPETDKEPAAGAKGPEAAGPQAAVSPGEGSTRSPEAAPPPAAAPQAAASPDAAGKNVSTAKL